MDHACSMFTCISVETYFRSPNTNGPWPTSAALSRGRWLSCVQAMCKLFYFVQNLTYSCSVLILTLISLERYIAIKHPMLIDCCGVLRPGRRKMRASLETLFASTIDLSEWNGTRC